MALPQVLVFASGTKDGGGSGFQNLVEWSRNNSGSFEVVGVVSNHENGGVKKRADALGVPFIFFPPGSEYSSILQNTRITAEWFALSGWLKMVHGLDPAKTFNIHPALLSVADGRFGGQGMWGSHVLDAVYGALTNGELTEFGISMHFVTDEYDRGPVFFEYRMSYREGITKEEVAEAVHAAEHDWQPKITKMVANAEISWDGKDAGSVSVPSGYAHLPRSSSR